MAFFSPARADQYEARASARRLWDVENKAVAGLLLSVERGKSVLDIPVGTGRFLPIYAELGLDVTGFDASPNMLKWAKDRGAGARLEVASVFEIPADDGAFDVTVCVRLMHLIDHSDFVLALREIQRVTRERIILTVRLGGERAERHGPDRAKALAQSLGDWRVVSNVAMLGDWHLVDLCRADVR